MATLAFLQIVRLGIPSRRIGRDTVSEWLRRWTRNPLGSARRGSNPLAVGCAKQPQGNKGRVQDGIAWERLKCSRGESCWCPDGTSTPGAWRHAGVRSLLPGKWQRLYSSVVQRQTCKLEVLGSTPSEGDCRTRQARSKTTTTDHKPNQRGTMRTPGVEPGSQA